MAKNPQPAKKSYFFSKGYTDLGNTIKGAWQRNGESIKNYASNLGDLGDRSTAGKLFFGILNVLAIIAVLVCGSLITAVITIINIAVLLIFMLLVYIGFSVIWLTDRIYLMRNKIFTACHECKEKSLIPTYICPKCGAHHTNLTPGIYGILHRTCNCGEKLPTTFFNGRKDLAAECPHCGHSLSDRESRPICIPIVGGRSVGKTAFITAFSKEFIENIVRIPKRTVLFRECDTCGANKNGTCEWCPTGDTLGIGDYEEVPLSHRCHYGNLDKSGNVASMSELCCPVCHKPVHKIVGDNIIISIIGSRDSGKSHYIGVLIHEILNTMANEFDWVIIPEANTVRLYEANFSRIYTAYQTLDLTTKNHDGFYDPYIFYITGKKGKTFTLTIYDTAGEDFESDDLMENSAKHAFHADGIVFLIDPLKIANVYTVLSQEVVNNSSSVSANRAFQNDAILSILSTSLRRHHKIKETKKISVPLAVLLPKLDVIAPQFPPHYACLFQSGHAKTKGFNIAENRRVNTEIRKWLSSVDDGAINSFLAQLEMNYSTFSYFGASALGMKNAPDKDGNFSTPKPHRVEDPILWILKEKGVLKEKK